jgi:aminotransferase
MEIPELYTSSDERLTKWLEELDRGLQHSEIRLYTDLCSELGAVNLAQGLFHVEATPEKKLFIKKYRQALRCGLRVSRLVTYVGYQGLLKLRKLIKDLEYARNGLPATEKNVIVTVGALGALHCALEAFLRRDDEVILFQPFYSFHKDQLLAKDINIRAVTLHPRDWSFEFKDLEEAVGPRTKAIILNSPANPSGKVFTRNELEYIAHVCKKKNLIAISDEVYEYMIYNGERHISIASMPGMWSRTIKISSFGKMLGCTGVRLGYAVAHEALIEKMGCYNEFGVACAPAPAQWGALKVLEKVGAEPFQEHATIFRKKRDILCDALQAARWKFSKPDGAGYILADVSELMEELGVSTSKEVAVHMMHSPGIGTVPAHDCYCGDERDETGKRQLRLCFGMPDKELHKAANLLVHWDRKPSQVSASTWARVGIALSP